MWYCIYVTMASFDNTSVVMLNNTDENYFRRIYNRLKWVCLVVILIFCRVQSNSPWYYIRMTSKLLQFWSCTVSCSSLFHATEYVKTVLVWPNKSVTAIQLAGSEYKCCNTYLSVSLGCYQLESWSPGVTWTLHFSAISMINLLTAAHCCSWQFYNVLG